MIFLIKFNLAILCLLMFSCAKTYKFNNPADPKCEKDSSNPKSCVDTSNGASTSTDPSSTGTTTSTDGSSSSNTGGGVSAPQGGTPAGTTSTAENAPAGSVFNFAHSFSVRPQTCTDVKKVRVFDNGSDLMIFLQANCGERSSVYALQTEYNGTQKVSPKNVSSDCNTGTTGVVNFDADQGNTNYMIVYSCIDGTGHYSTKTVTIDNTAQIGTPLTIENNCYNTSDCVYSITWNESGDAFGVARYNLFQRVSEDGNLIGGALTPKIDVGYGNYIIDGKWAFRDDNSLSTITEAGIAGCKAVSSPPSLNGTYFRKYFLDKSNLLTSYARINGEISNITRVDYDLTSCLDGSDIKNTVVLGNIASNYIRTLLINDNIAGAYYISQEDSLILATFSRAGNFTIYSEASIASFNTRNSIPQLRVIQDKIYAAYDKDGNGYVSYANESVQGGE